MNGDAAPVVVGVDGSDSSNQAVAVAATLAAERHRPLRVVHAFIWPELHAPLGPSPYGPAEGGLTNQADQIVAEAIALATRSAPEVAVSGGVVVGAPVAVLLDAGRDAALVVLGSRGLGGFTGLLVGSVAVQVTAHSTCPVVVVRGEVDRAGDVVVGVDGSAAGQATLAFAFEQAALRPGVGVTAVHAYALPMVGGITPVGYDTTFIDDAAKAVIETATAGWADRYPDIALRRVVVLDQPARALLHAAQQASMLVVGSRGPSGIVGLLLGSVSHAAIHHASCPVAIVR